MYYYHSAPLIIWHEVSEVGETVYSIGNVSHICTRVDCTHTLYITLHIEILLS